MQATGACGEDLPGVSVRPHGEVPLSRQGVPHGLTNDLDEIKGIGPQHKEMLNSIGVDSIKELRHRNAAHLKEMIETRHGKVVGLSEKTCQDLDRRRQGPHHLTGFRSRLPAPNPGDLDPFPARPGSPTCRLSSDEGGSGKGLASATVTLERWCRRVGNSTAARARDADVVNNPGRPPPARQSDIRRAGGSR